MKKLIQSLYFIGSTLMLAFTFTLPVCFFIGIHAIDIFLFNNNLKFFDYHYWIGLVVIYLIVLSIVVFYISIGKIKIDPILKKQELYYIRTQGFIGNGLVWWRPNEAGYTSDIDKAGTYTYDEAYSICKGTHGDNMAYKCSSIDNMEEGLTLQVHSDYAPKPDIGTHFGEEIQ